MKLPTDIEKEIEAAALKCAQKYASRYVGGQLVESGRPVTGPDMFDAYTAGAREFYSRSLGETHLAKQDRDSWKQAHSILKKASLEYLKEMDTLVSNFEAIAENMAKALESTNKTLKYVQDVSAHGAGATLIKESFETNERALKDYRKLYPKT